MHEWGTFTSLEDETGKSLGGINVDDEPVPSFVHTVSSAVLGPQHSVTPKPPIQKDDGKGGPPCYPYVTMRLETPVMYFYPPKSQSLPQTLDVGVKFHSGWLTQFYPNAAVAAPDINRNQNYNWLTHDTVGSLDWNQLQVGTNSDGPQTDEPVWLAPRNVRATAVKSADGESEKYLFYRGLGNIESPLKIASNSEGTKLSLRSGFSEVLQPKQTEKIRALWLVQIRSDGSTAYRTLEPITVSGDSGKVLTVIKGDFNDADFSIQNRERLQSQMHAALVADGLFDEEATAMLTTWEKSYFRNGGLRLFFIVPRAWTEHYLPLTISQPAEITRVMMGRTELISSEQRTLLKKLAATPNSDPSWLKTIPESAAAKKFLSGRSDFGDLGVNIPLDYRTYLELGRFRNALLLYEQARTRSKSLANFIDNYNLHAFQVKESRPVPPPPNVHG